MKAKLLTGIRPLWFFLAFGVGLLACYILAPGREVVVRFPSPQNAGKVVYRDDADASCFVYDATPVDCDAAQADRLRAQPAVEA